MVANCVLIFIFYLFFIFVFSKRVYKSIAQLTTPLEGQLKSDYLKYKVDRGNPSSMKQRTGNKCFRKPLSTKPGPK